MTAVDNSVNYSLGVEFYQAKLRLSRIKHLSFVSFWCSIILLNVITTNYFQAYPLFSHVTANLLVFIGLYQLFKIGIHRLHDFNWRGGWILGYAVPLVGLLWFVLVCLMPGTAGENRYGMSSPATYVDYVRLLATPTLLLWIYLL